VATRFVDLRPHLPLAWSPDEALVDGESGEGTPPARASPCRCRCLRAACGSSQQELPFLLHDEDMPRPRLRPGTVVRRRTTTSLQLGVSGSRVLRDRPGLMAALALLDGSHSTSTLKQLLVRRGFNESLESLLGELSALDVLAPARRTRTPVNFSAPGAARDFVTTMLRVGADDLHVRPDASVLVMIDSSEPPRDMYRTAQAAGLPHLPIVFDADHVHLGPWSVPGLTPCVDCMDAELSRWDDSWPVLVAQFDRHTLRLPLGVTSTVQHQAAGIAVAWLTGSAPAGTRLTIGPDGSVHEFAFGFAPGCMCQLVAPVPSAGAV
jgi:hypothetical protein